MWKDVGIAHMNYKLWFCSIGGMKTNNILLLKLDSLHDHVKNGIMNHNEVPKRRLLKSVHICILREKRNMMNSNFLWEYYLGYHRVLPSHSYSICSVFLIQDTFTCHFIVQLALQVWASEINLDYNSMKMFINVHLILMHLN